MWLTMMSAALACPSSAPEPAAPRLPPPAAPFDHEVRIEGMTARWRVDDDTWVVQLDAETRGWLVLGTNPHAGLTGADLFFGWVVDGTGQAAHHVVEAPGRHVAASDPHLTLLAAAQTPRGTAVRLRVPAPSPAPDGGIWLILAWSHAPELDHHSAVRQHVRVPIPARSKAG